MKKGVLLLLALFLLPVTYGFGININNPASNSALTGTNDIQVTLDFSGDMNGNASTVYFYYKNMSEEWHLLYANTSANFTRYNYLFDSSNFYDTIEGYLNVTVSNHTGTYQNVSVAIPIKINNNAPVYGIIPNLTWLEDTVNDALNLSMYFSDAEKRNSFSYSYSSVDKFGISINGNTGIVTITPNANYSGTELIRFTASDGSLSNTSNYVMLYVINVNDRPLFNGPIQNKTLVKNTKITIKLYDYFSDPEKDDLTYTYVAEKGYVSVSMDPSGIAVITPNQDFLGVDTIIFNASDGNTTTGSNKVFFEYIARTDNKAPVLSSPSPAESSLEMNDGENKTFMITKSDPNNDTLSVKWYVNSELKAENSDSYTFTAGSAGTYAIKAEVSDGVKFSSNTWAVKVKAEDNSTVVLDSQESLCGNNLVDAGEDCESCPNDVICKDNESCINKLCTVMGKKSNLPMIAGILALVAIITVAVVLLYQKKKSNELFVPVKSITIQPAKKSNINIGESPVAEIGDFYSAKKYDKGNIKTQKIDYINEEKKGSSKTETALIRSYVKMAMEKNMPIEKIKKNLTSKGWDAQRVDSIIKEIR